MRDMKGLTRPLILNVFDSLDPQPVQDETPTPISMWMAGLTSRLHVFGYNVQHSSGSADLDGRSQ